MTTATTRQTVSPLDLAPIAEFPVGTPAQVDAGVRAARAAQPHWAGLGFARRGQALRQVRARFAAAKGEWLDALRRENGKSEHESLFTEILPTFDLFDYWIGNTEKLLAQELLPLDPVKFPSKRGKIVYEPKGVIAVISPWNYPVNLPLRTILPALMAGNTVVFKPSEYGSLSGRILGRLFDECLPEGVVGTVLGDGTTGAALVTSGVDHVSFTGSLPTGRKVALSCAERLVTCSIELGGKAAAIVLADADLHRAVNGLLYAKFHAGGQNCSAPERIYVQAPVADRFAGMFRDAAARLRVGVEGEYPLVPLRTEAQRAHVARQVEEARQGGATVLVGGAPAAGTGYEPTVVTGAPERSALLTRETFGPAVAIVPFETVEDAIRKANESDVGLTASVWTRDLGAGERIAQRLDVGVATVNNACFTGVMPFAPWGGRKLSGFGYTSSHLALRELVHAKTIVVDGERASQEMWWYPYTATRRAIADRLFALLSGTGGLPDVVALLGLMPKRFKG